MYINPVKVFLAFQLWYLWNLQSFFCLVPGLHCHLHGFVVNRTSSWRQSPSPGCRVVAHSSELEHPTWQVLIEYSLNRVVPGCHFKARDSAETRSPRMDFSSSTFCCSWRGRSWHTHMIHMYKQQKCPSYTIITTCRSTWLSKRNTFKFIIPCPGAKQKPFRWKSEDPPGWWAVLPSVRSSPIRATCWSPEDCTHFRNPSSVKWKIWAKHYSSEIVDILCMYI